MTLPLTRQATDHSTDLEFTFSFYCDRCGREWRSIATPYIRAGFTDISCRETEIRIWNDEHRMVFERANLEAMLHFNYCKACGRWVCDECFAEDANCTQSVCLDCLESQGNGAKLTGAPWSILSRPF